VARVVPAASPRASALPQLGHLLAEGDAPDRDAAELAAESEVSSVHPPTDHLIDELVG